MRLAESGCGTLSVLVRLAHTVAHAAGGVGLTRDGSLGSRLRDVRLRQGRSLRAVSRASGICSTAVSEVDADGRGGLSTVVVLAGARHLAASVSAHAREKIVP